MIEIIGITTDREYDETEINYLYDVHTMKFQETHLNHSFEKNASISQYIKQYFFYTRNFHITVL